MSVNALAEASKSDLAQCFVPEILVNYIKNCVICGKEKIEPTSFYINGVCLLVDISGFTKMSEQFCGDGKNGIDELQLTTNGYMGQLVEVIYDFGGDIIKFAGDAVICIFARDNYEEGEDVHCELILRAMHCARVLREVRTDSLTVHVAMSCGEMCFGILGGYENRWECLVSGPCIQQLSACLDDALSMQSVISPECAAILTKSVASTQLHVSLQEGVTPSERFTITTTVGVYEYQLSVLQSGNRRIARIHLDELHHRNPTPKQSRKSPLLRTQQIAAINRLTRLFVPAPIGEELDNGSGLSYMAEIREVTTMFMKWDSYDANGKHKNLLELQACFYQAQRILYTTGAYLRQFLVDDKGCVLIACWGVPHLSYSDNALRALSAATQIQHELHSLGMITSVGITTGDVYCGTVGSVRRMEYAVIGSDVNMAARLMGKAKGGLLLGKTSFVRLPQSTFKQLEEVEPMMVKGKATPLQAYRYLVPSSQSTKSASSSDLDGIELPEECRSALKSLLRRSILALDRDKRNSAQKSPASAGRVQGMASPTKQQQQVPRVPHLGSDSPTNTSWFTFPSFKTDKYGGDHMAVVLIKGSEGSGRSTAISWMRAEAANKNVPCISVKLTKKESSMDFCMWKKLFAQFMPKDLFLNHDTQRSLVWGLLRKVFPHNQRAVEFHGFPALKTALGITCHYKDDQQGYTPPPAKSKKVVLARSISAMFGGGSNHSSPHFEYVPIQDTLVKIFTYLLNTYTTVCLVEHIELADNESLSLLAELLKIRTRSSFVLTALRIDKTHTDRKRVGGFLLNRKYKVDALNSTSWSRQYKQLVTQHKSTTSIMLENYTAFEIDQMLSVALGGGPVPADVGNLVHEFSGGNCVSVREIIECIKDNGIAQFMSALGGGEDNQMSHRTVGGQAKQVSRRSNSSSSPNRGQPQRSNLSRQTSFTEAGGNHSQVKMDKVVLCRLNNLSSDVQRVLRSASIIGRSFSAKVLFDVLPKHLKDAMYASLDTLQSHKWLNQDLECETNYQFAHPQAHRVIYQLTPSSERNNLHQRIADTMAVMFADDRIQFASICYHYQHCDTDKALQYAVKATVVMLETEDIFDFGDCLDLLFGSFICCLTLSDVATLQQLVRDVTTGIEKCNLRSGEDIAVTGSMLASVYSLFEGIRPRTTKVSPHLILGLVSPGRTAATSDGDIRGSPQSLKARTKAEFLTQLDTLSDQLHKREAKLQLVRDNLFFSSLHIDDVAVPVCA